MNVNRILIFGLDVAKNQTLLADLNARGIAVTLCANIDLTLSLLQNQQHDVAIIFLSRAAEGLSLLDQINQQTARSPRFPLLIATENEARDLRLAGLDSGAIDFLVWPFDADQLLTRADIARVRSQAKRKPPQKRKKVVIDRDGRIGDGTSWTWLTPSEGQTISLLMKHRDQTVTKETLKLALDKRQENGPEITDNAIGVAIYRLRSKIRPYGLDIRTRRKVGYVLEEMMPTTEISH